jgi:hypothetical protein
MEESSFSGAQEQSYCKFYIKKMCKLDYSYCVILKISKDVYYVFVKSYSFIDLRLDRLPLGNGGKKEN